MEVNLRELFINACISVNSAKLVERSSNSDVFIDLYPLKKRNKRWSIVIVVCYTYLANNANVKQKNLHLKQLHPNVHCSKMFIYIMFVV